jgi:hypothetical protein
VLVAKFPGDSGLSIIEEARQTFTAAATFAGMTVVAPKADLPNV